MESWNSGHWIIGGYEEVKEDTVIRIKTSQSKGECNYSFPSNIEVFRLVAPCDDYSNCGFCPFNLYHIKEIEGIFDFLNEIKKSIRSTIRSIKKGKHYTASKVPRRTYLKPWKDPESLFCDREFLEKEIGLSVRKCEDVRK